MQLLREAEYHPRGSPTGPELVSERDLAAALDLCADDLVALGSAHIFFTGGTGFVGKWLLTVFLYAVRRLGLRARATVLTRNPELFQTDAPQLVHERVTLARGDIRKLPALPRFDAIIHAAMPSAANFMSDAPGSIAIAFDGSREVLALCRRSGTIPVLVTSSGAVYGKRRSLSPVSEECLSGPDPCDPSHLYHESKRAIEMLFAADSSIGRVDAKIARLFAFVGPYLPLNGHFAVGNFTRDAVAETPIRITGNPKTVRSYLYGSDMAVWLWRILARGETMRPYNVGSMAAIRLEDLARLIIRRTGSAAGIDVCGSATVPAADAYVPDTSRIARELQVHETVSLTDSIDKYVRYARNCLQSGA